jgi:asparagine synthase (glutamine-hydrolysing)
MCGLAGWVGNVGATEETLVRMCDAISHRGPDEMGSHVRPGRVGLGFRRLSIIDLSTGSQPIANEDGSVHVCCNGEIYNFRALRSELAARGHRFRTRSDSEVIVHLYEEIGERCLERLDGMFAIAVWDDRRNRLLLARDRLGVKPLYWTRASRGLLYGSEPAAIFASGLVPARPDVQSLADYLTLQYVPAPRTGFEAVAKLRPGERLLFDGERTDVARYWAPDFAHKLNLSDREALDRIDALLEAGTRDRLVADVPVGAFLSGGIDSSLVVSYMAQHSTQVKTFSIDFADERFSEARHARRVAALYGTDHEEMLVEPEVIPTIAEVARHAGEPFGDSSAIPTYLLSQMTRRHVTVALSGDGGDEAFAGYERHRIATYLDRAGPLLGVAGALGQVRTGDDRSRLGRVARGLRAASRPAHERYATLMAHFSPVEIERLCTPAFLRACEAPFSAWKDELSLPPWKGVDRYAALDTATYLPGDLLLKVDRMSMAHALEVRSPLLAYQVHEFAAALPPRMKLRRGTSKWLLKQLAVRRGLPHDLVHRSKQGFGVPVGEWFRGELRPWLEDLLLDPHTLGRGYFRREEVERLLREHIDRRADHRARLWNLAMLESWHRVHLDRAAGTIAGSESHVTTAA